MDIGCGTGRVTSLIDCRLRCEQIVALDFDIKAIKHAEANFSSPRISYVIDDIASPWNELCPAIRKLENKVDLIISNRVLHWIEDKQQAIENIYRLLRKNGKLYTNISTVLNLFDDLSVEEQKQFSKLIHLPTEIEQIENYRQLFEAVNFRLDLVESIHLQQIYPKNEFESIILQYFPNLSKKCLLEKDPERRDQIMTSTKLKDYVQKAFLRLYTREIIEDDNALKYELTYGQIRIIAEKP
ncbi:acid methyltransferase-like protein [Sarcoptes scabiei]|nr:acid methyltransferase-like protein [Sarcoptes scabiei]